MNRLPGPPITLVAPFRLLLKNSLRYSQLWVQKCLNRLFVHILLRHCRVAVYMALSEEGGAWGRDDSCNKPVAKNLATLFL
jgi:hypothetical protein